MSRRGPQPCRSAAGAPLAFGVVEHLLRRTFVFGLAIALASTLMTVTPTTPANADSMTNGNVTIVGASECNGYVLYGLLARKLELAGFAPTAPCESSARPARAAAAAAALPVIGSTVVITLGLNPSPTNFRADIQAAATALRARGAQRIIWFTTASEGHIFDSIYAVNNPILVEEGARLGIEVVRWDLLADPATITDDGAHYDREGYLAFADKIVEMVSFGQGPYTAGVRGPCDFVSAGIGADYAADLFAVSVAEINAANPLWDHSQGSTVCRPTDEVAPPDLPASEAGFIDTVGTVFEADIDWLAAEGITSGCGKPFDEFYCPNANVTHGQMAAFLVRALGLTDVGTVDFVDDDASVFETDIAKLATAGVTRGCNPPDNDRYCPGARVTRGQMAAFLVRAFGFAAVGSVDFVDDDASVFETDIAKLATAGVTKGCNPPLNDRYCPSAPVTRGQMAAFLHRATTAFAS